MKKEIQSNNVPSYLLPVNDLDIEDELHLPTVPTGRQAIQVLMSLSGVFFFYGKIFYFSFLFVWLCYYR